nr:MAG: Protein of unknown function (DUF2829) [Bacteriophage sp.]
MNFIGDRYINLNYLIMCEKTSSMSMYIGTKVVMAMPMTLTEAQKVLGREIKPATVEEDGYLVEYKDGYMSWSPKSVFDDAYRKLVGMDFGEVIDVLKSGLAVRRKGWNGKGMFVVKQIPSHIEGGIIPTMQSLPQSAKDILLSRENAHIDYTNQMLIINPDGRADSWIPSSSDVFAEDWEIVQTEEYGDFCPDCAVSSASPIED